MKPRIGVTTGYKNGVQQVDHHYIRAVEVGGGIPLIVPMVEDASTAQEFATLLDGLIMIGGPAITKGLIGALPPDLGETDPIRIHADELIFAALSDRPVLGICYGMQFINAQAGGTIYADVLAQRPNTLLHSADRGSPGHTVTFAEGSRLAVLLGRRELAVNSHHIQAVRDLGTGLHAVGFSPDGIIEGLESEDGRLLGVQFHPERMLAETLPLFEGFIQNCRKG